MKYSGLTTVALALAGVTVILGGAALATPPGTNGRIAFRRYANPAKTSGAVFTMQADGSGLTQITHPPAGNVDDQPDWAAGGTQMVFCRINSKGSCAITVVNADGSGLKSLTKPCDALPPKCVDRYAPSFAPDGNHIVYTRASGKLRKFAGGAMMVQHSAIGIMGTDGRRERQIYRLPPYAADIENAQMSPDARFVVFERSNGPKGKNAFGRAVFVVRSDGSGLRQLTPWKLAAGDGADWSPDGSHLLFRSKEGVDEHHSQYFTVRPDGSDLTQLTHFPAGTKIFSATWSPDGTQIVFAKGDARESGDIWVMNADGTNQHPILQVPQWDSAPDWASAG
jgi:Tol biopolymer transport system component